LGKKWNRKHENKYTPSEHIAHIKDAIDSTHYLIGYMLEEIG